MANIRRFWAYAKAMASLRMIRKEEEEEKNAGHKDQRKPLG